ncbi:TetR/AcrR family transcriptional regulator [Streptococcus panodentis]|uniref:TetR/AcrR family transcriptional regulator n=1 Tax=Streptococcus panodentis TaxID=1581472 RepID=A0ABS5AUI1_9STRE|nr:TetR/AcrR family transcriptional regulator [Streptococcus panodentis]MBP2620145.1 TetR/AcrR family transcriptional regulator [Streptococcus panodentis]
MPKGFTIEEKKILIKKFKEACSRSWMTFGYKKTSVDLLCQEAGIAKGSFYTFFKNKEELFFQVYCDTQDETFAVFEETLKANPSKAGFAAALKAVFKEYEKSTFVFDTKNPDFLSFENKLSLEQRQEITSKTSRLNDEIFSQSFLSLKIEKNLAISVLSATMATITHKNQLPADIEEVFSFMIENLVDAMFE